jgi:hypothetical protein
LVPQETPMFWDIHVLEPGQCDLVQKDDVILEDRKGKQIDEGRV